MKPLRLISIAGALCAASLGLSACDASPYAATVDGHVITVNSLNHVLASWASNRAWVQGFDAANSPSQGGNGTTVVGTGGNGTYNSKFVALILGTMVEVYAVRQHLAASGNLPSADEVVASRAVNEYLRGQYWYQFPQQVRDFFVERLADWGALTTPPLVASSLQGPYNDIQPYLFSKVCVAEASAFSSAQAQAIIASKTVKGTQVCFDQKQLEAQPQAFQSAVRNLTTVGDISSAIKTSYGFQVLQLTRRDTPGFSAAVQRVILAAETPPSSLNGILGSAHVKVNPRYGTWANGQVAPPQQTNS